MSAVLLASSAAGSSPVAEAIRDRLEADAWPALAVGGERLHAANVLADFYDGRGFEPAWTRDWTRIAQLMETLASAAGHGLRPSDYHQAALAERVAGARTRAVTPDQLADLDLLASDAFVLYALHLGRGKVREERIAGWHVERPDLDLTARLREAVATGPDEALAAVAPGHPGYHRLREALSTLRSIQAEGGWPVMAAGRPLRVGDRGSRVSALRARLVLGGDLAAAGGAAADDQTPGFDARIEAAVRRFQTRHGLEEDGVVGSRTRAAMNVPAGERVRGVEVNLERWRWLARDLGKRYVLVNVAGFFAGLHDEDRLILGMRAVVGRPYRRTPIFSDRIRYLVFSPYWNIPARIARDEILPKGETYMARNDIERVGSRLRQRPGPHNALGRVKFMFPNRFNVYLHDTPARSLFDEATRSFSHGCIRVARPLELAAELLAGQGWTREEVAAAAARRQPLRVSLDAPVPVHILYWTAWVDEQGTLQFRDDLYRRDAAVRRALASGPPR
jgi:murein L,D-transpeptidase YcbB/YkuD